MHKQLRTGLTRFSYLLDHEKGGHPNDRRFRRHRRRRNEPSLEDVDQFVALILEVQR